MGPYIAAMLAVITYMIICVASVFLVYSLMNDSNSKHLNNALIMLAVGTLIGDAMLHLLPKALGFEEGQLLHQQNSTSVLTPNKKLQQNLLSKTLTVIASLYLFYTLNWITVIIKCIPKHNHSHNLNDLLHGKYDDARESIKNQNREDDQNIELSNLVINENQEDVHLFSEITPNLDSAKDITWNHFPKSKEKENKIQRIPAVVYMIVLSSLLHNLTDGLAVGVAFSDCFSGGVSTAVAVLCHEVPHVMGHFIVLHTAGIPIQFVFLVISLTYIASILGALVGVALGTEFRAVDWIFAITTGMFLHVAMVQLLPEMIKTIHESPTWATYVSQNIGFVTGIGVMVLIAIFEDSIVEKLFTN